MKKLVFGSFNIDRVYTLPHLPEKGETLYTERYELHEGGKGLNQALSLTKASGQCCMAGCVGSDGDFLLDILDRHGTDTSLVMRVPGFTGHAVIEVDPDGQNQMILFPGANSEITEAYCDRVLSCFSAGDFLLMQCETSCTAYMLEKAKKKGLITAINPSPFTDKIFDLPLECVDYFILNEFEGQSLSGAEAPREICEALIEKYPGCRVILTLGGKGSVYYDGNVYTECPAFKVKAVDTTGAGDTFTGYVFTELLSGTEPFAALRLASAASALAVQRQGAAVAIPDRESVLSFLDENV